MSTIWLTSASPIFNNRMSSLPPARTRASALNSESREEASLQDCGRCRVKGAIIIKSLGCLAVWARKLATHLAHEPAIYDLSDNHIFLYPAFIFELLELLLEKLVTHGSVFGESLNQRAIHILGSSDIETILDGHEFAHVFFLCSDRFEGAQETAKTSPSI